MSEAVTKKRGFLTWLAELDDGVIIRTAFFIMLAGCGAVLWIDYRELNEAEIPLASLPAGDFLIEVKAGDAADAPRKLTGVKVTG